LKNNTLLSVVTFPDDLFNPSASVGTIGTFIKKGFPHDFNKQKVYFTRATQDGYKMKKGKRLLNKKVPNMLIDIKEELKSFIVNSNLNFKDIPEIKKICLLDKSDVNIELVPENYIDSKIPTLEEIKQGVDTMIRELVAFRIKYHKKLEESDLNENNDK
jgi:hypothetical protein